MTTTEFDDDLSLDDVCECHYDEEKENIPCAPCLYDRSYLIRKVCALFADNIASSMIHRHSRLLNEYLRVSQDGVLLRDLRYFIYAIEILGGKAEEQPEYRDLLREMLDLSCLSPLMIEPTEGLSPMQEVEELFNSLGYLLATLEDLELRLRVAHTVHCLLTRHRCTGENCVPLRVLHAAVERSSLTGVVGQFLEFALPELYTALVDLALLLSSLSIHCSQILANTGTIDFILLRLDPEYPLETTAEFKDPCEVSSLDEVETSLLWGMLRALQMMDEFPSHRRTPSSEALRCLSKCLHSVVQDGYISGAISLMSLVLLALHLFPDLPVAEAGLADDIATLSVASELHINEEWTKTILVDRTREAFEFKRLLLLSICYLAQQNAAIEILRKRKVAIGLLRMAEPHAIELSPWHHTLSTALADLALHALIAISVTAPHDVVKCGGLSYFLLVIETFTSQIAQIDSEKLLACFTALYYISSFRDNNFLREVNDTGAICIILRFCHSLLNMPDFPFAQQDMLSKAFLVLKLLCKNNMQEKERHGGIIIKILDLFLKLVLSPNISEEPFPIDDKLVICAVDFIWEAIILCPINCESIVKEGHVYRLLDLLQISIFPVQLILLGLLVDLIEFGNCIAHIITWRGNNKCAFLSLLMNVWRQEELFISPHRDSVGCISEATLPLMGREQWFQTYADKKNFKTSPAILDMYASARPKIYAIVKLLKNRYQEITQEIEEFYHAHNDLQKEKEITMQLVDKYLEMKIKEVWNEIAHDLTSASIIPTESDSNMMIILNDKLLHLAYQIQKQQHKLVQDIKNRELKDEKNLYELVEGSNAIEENETMKELETLASANDPFYMNAVKQLERQQISTTFPLNLPLSQCFNSYTSDPLCKLILHQHYNVRCRKDFGLKNLGFVNTLDTTESSKALSQESKASEASQAIGSNSDLF